MDKDSINNNPVENETRSKFWKFWIIMILISLGFVAVVIKLFYIQVIDADKYKKLAKKQQEAKVTLRAVRGNIYDKNGILLASTVQGISIALDPSIVDDIDVLSAKLEKITGISAKSIKDKYNKSNSSFIWIARGLLPSLSDKLDSIKDAGLIKILEPRRNYLFAPVCSQVVGCTDIDNKGISGIELSMDTALSGRSGFIIMQRDATGKLHPTANLPLIEAEHGKNITLTIDIEIQKIAEYELKQGVEKAKALSGTVIAIEPSTGDILAMASYPGYNPNQISEMSAGGMRNRAVTDLYEPGSTFKMITAASSLDLKLISPGTMLDGHNGVLDFGKYVINDDHPIGRVTFAEALEQSSNICFSTVGYGIPDNDFYKYVRDFGFGNALGIELPGEVSGKIKKANELTAITKRFLAFGYGIAVTPLQLITAYSTLANKGMMVKPHIIKSIVNTDGETVKFNKPDKIRQVISEKTAKTLTNMLIGVVERGTGKSAKIEGVNIAGKTGTTQKLVGGQYSKQDYMASFIGFFPAENPRIVLFVLLDKPQGNYYGGSTSAPIFHDIALKMIYSNPELARACNLDTTAKQIDSVIVPDFSGLTLLNAEKIATSKNLIIKSYNNIQSEIISQSPKAGLKVAKGAEIKLETKKSESKSKNKIIPSVKGLSLRNAIEILHNAGIKVKVIGSGIVQDQSFTKENNETICILVCHELNK